MAMGLRVSEARPLKWDDIITDDQGRPACVIRAEHAKTDTTRVAALVEPEVYEHLTGRRDEVGGTYVVGLPLNPDTKWNRFNAQKVLKTFYGDLARDCDVPLLETHRTHVWRTTLNALYRTNVDALLRARTLGHSLDVNAQAYSDLSDLTTLYGAARARREEGE